MDWRYVSRSYFSMTHQNLEYYETQSTLIHPIVSEEYIRQFLCLYISIDLSNLWKSVSIFYQANHFLFIYLLTLSIENMIRILYNNTLKRYFFMFILSKVIYIISSSEKKQIHSHVSKMK